MASIEQLSAREYVDQLLACKDKPAIRALNKRDEYRHVHTYLGQRAVKTEYDLLKTDLEKDTVSAKRLRKIISFATSAEEISDDKASRKTFNALCESTKIISAEPDYFKDPTYFDYLIKKADAGHHFACHFLAMHYIGGRNPQNTRDNTKAIEYLTKAAAGDFPASQAFIDQLTKETESSA